MGMKARSPGRGGAPTALERFAALAIRRGVSLSALRSASARDFALVLAAAAQGFAPDRDYSEPEVNELLRDFLGAAGTMLATDHVELRRWLVDNRLLGRDGYGRVYTARTPAADVAALAQELAGIDLASIARAARDSDALRRAERKARWQVRKQAPGG